MGCNRCTSQTKRATAVQVVKEATKTVKKKKPKIATKFMHIQTSGINKRRAFNILQARAQKRIKRKEQHI